MQVPAGGKHQGVKQHNVKGQQTANSCVGLNEHRIGRRNHPLTQNLQPGTHGIEILQLYPLVPNSGMLGFIAFNPTYAASLIIDCASSLL